MTCRDVTEFLMAYVAGELPEDVRPAFADHLARCRNCRIFLEQYRDTIVAGRQAFTDLDADASTELPPDLFKAIMAAVPGRKN
jgi:anti-sigma factor RsiW